MPAIYQEHRTWNKTSALFARARPACGRPPKRWPTNNGTKRALTGGWLHVRPPTKTTKTTTRSNDMDLIVDVQLIDGTYRVDYAKWDNGRRIEVLELAT